MKPMQSLGIDNMLDLYSSGFLIIDESRVILQWNHWLENLSRKKKHDTISKPINEVLSKLEGSSLEQAIAICFDKGVSRILSAKLHPKMYQHFSESKSGSEYKVLKVLVSPLSIDSSNCVAIQVFDQTSIGSQNKFLHRQVDDLNEQKHLVEQSKKMASIGQMASGIVHEINNPLSVVMLRAELLKSAKKTPDKKSLDNSMDKITSMIERIYHIIKGLKIIAHQGKYQFEEAFSVKKMLREAIDLTKEKLDQTKVRIDIDFGSWDDIMLFGDEVHISQIVINLLNNAIDAAEDLPEPWVKVEIIELEQLIQINVLDCGEGISKEVQEKIFDPFFTSKPAGKGTGLGLSISASIANAHQGNLYINNGFSNTCFTLSLPKYQKDD